MSCGWTCSSSSAGGNFRTREADAAPSPAPLCAPGAGGLRGDRSRGICRGLQANEALPRRSTHLRVVSSASQELDGGGEQHELCWLALLGAACLSHYPGGPGGG